jgi:hypothetical protein
MGSRLDGSTSQWQNASVRNGPPVRFFFYVVQFKLIYSFEFINLVFPSLLLLQEFGASMKVGDSSSGLETTPRHS